MGSKILVFGAGNIGLSFVGQIFGRSGYEAVFVDMDSDICDRLNEHGSYQVNLLSPDGSVDPVTIRPVRAIHAKDTAALRQELVSRPLIATAVGLRAFPMVLAGIRDALAGSGVSSSGLDVVAAENIHDPRALARDSLGEEAPSIHACSVGKMVPLQERAPTGPLVVRAEAFNTLIVDGSDWRTAPPTNVSDLRLVEDIEPWMDRKLYVHNLGHAACAWLSRARHPELQTIAEGIAQSDIRQEVGSIMHSMVDMVSREYPGTFQPADTGEHVDDLLDRFGNKALGDTVERVGRDIERKLGRHDRLVGAMFLCARYAESDDAARAVLEQLATVAVHATRFGVPGISGYDRDLEINEQVSASSPQDVIRALAGLSDGPNDALVIEALEATE